MWRKVSGSESRFYKYSFGKNAFSRISFIFTVMSATGSTNQSKLFGFTRAKLRNLSLSWGSCHKNVKYILCCPLLHKRMTQKHLNRPSWLISLKETHRVATPLSSSHDICWAVLAIADENLTSFNVLFVHYGHSVLLCLFRTVFLVRWV
jgi:hypothetical protein